MRPAIQVEGVSKIYKVHSGPRALLKELLFRIPAHHQVVALQDVSFTVAEGEAFGIVGENGAGKTTLLKLLTGTAFPTAGRLQVQGKVSALLELGAGFHPDFTGRENIYFNGALMGLSRGEIRGREEEIIAFSELQEFIDRPVKTYSSGMYVRLGFAVATGFDPSVLIIDEALAVGDQRFQKKCTDRILEFRRRGKTILFCSHNLYQVKRLCKRALWLKKGCPAALGDVQEVVDAYTNYCRDLERGSGPGRSPATPYRKSTGSPSICRIEKVRLTAADGQERQRFETGEALNLDIWAYFSPEFKGTPGIGVSLVRNDGTVIYSTSSITDGFQLTRTADSLYHGRLTFPQLPLLAGLYRITAVTTDHENLQAYHIAEEIETFVVSSQESDFGLVRLQHFWSSGTPD